MVRRGARGTSEGEGKRLRAAPLFPGKEECGAGQPWVAQAAWWWCRLRACGAGTRKARARAPQTR